MTENKQYNLFFKCIITKKDFDEALKVALKKADKDGNELIGIVEIFE